MSKTFFLRKAIRSLVVRRSSLLGLFLFTTTLAFAQKDLDQLLKRYNTRAVPYISVQELKMEPAKYLILDTRKKEEFDVSHLPGAVWAGEKPNEAQLKEIAVEPDQPIVVYCSVGVRSEDFGQRLQQMGYKNVNNLYGSIFLWKDTGYTVVDSTGHATERVHVYAKKWGKYLKTGKKVYAP